MKYGLRWRSLFFALLLVHLFLLLGCSYSTDFVVVNESEQPIEIRYRVKKSTAGSLAVSGIPAIIEASRLSTHGGQEWNELVPER